ncbi:MAG: hypothetical protein JWN70_3505 [Planctomycetaceae bacterium]|nr:hypothetical protein [Planctomycetaceae bacterium]
MSDDSDHFAVTDSSDDFEGIYRRMAALAKDFTESFLKPDPVTYIRGILQQESALADLRRHLQLSALTHIDLSKVTQFAPKFDTQQGQPVTLPQLPSDVADLLIEYGVSIQNSPGLMTAFLSNEAFMATAVYNSGGRVFVDAHFSKSGSMICQHSVSEDTASADEWKERTVLEFAVLIASKRWALEY